jgi:hypothetical protein
LNLPLPVLTTVVILDRNGNPKGMYQSGSSSLLSVSFTHNVNGCRDFSLIFASSVDILKADRIKIKLLNHASVFFTGVVRSAPIAGSIPASYEYSGSGYTDYLSRLNVGPKAYVNQTLLYIVNDIATSIVIAKSPIVFNGAKISLPVIVVKSLTLNYSQVFDSLVVLKKIADSTGIEHNFGVDAAGQFFFRPRDPTLIATLIVGKRSPYGIPAYRPVEEQIPRTRLIVLKNSGTYWTTLDSVQDNDIYEEAITAPNISNDDLTLWGLGYLYDSERIKRSADIEWPIDTSIVPDFVVADGHVRVLSNMLPSVAQLSISSAPWGDGNWGDGLWNGAGYQGANLDDQLIISEITYSLSTTGVTRSLSLGSIPIRVEKEIAEMNGRITSLKLSLGV